MMIKCTAKISGLGPIRCACSMQRVQRERNIALASTATLTRGRPEILPYAGRASDPPWPAPHISRSNSAKTPLMPNVAFPADVPVSKPCWRKRNGIRERDAPVDEWPDGSYILDGWEWGVDQVQPIDADRPNAWLFEEPSHSPYVPCCGSHSIHSVWFSRAPACPSSTRLMPLAAIGHHRGVGNTA